MAARALQWDHVAGTPNFGVAEGWIHAATVVEALRAAGSTLTPASIISGMNNVHAYTTDGLTPPIDFAKKGSTAVGLIGANCA